ncbi:MAG: quinolinate synthase NadA [Bacteriovoracaceae bacterium]
MIDLYDNIETNHLPKISEAELSDEDVLLELTKIKAELKDKVVVLGHHYQQDDVIHFADVTGDSLALAKYAATLKDIPYIMFCGVHFMAETADILTSDRQQVVLPDLRAGCSMADMAKEVDINLCWDFLSASTSEKIIPITYINCAATLKSFVGEHDGTICTSTNAKKIIEWAFTQGKKLLFFPDQHLGRNTCFNLGIPLSEMVTYDPRLPQGGLTAEQVKKAKVILWYGYCSVHQGFNVEQVRNLKKISPETTIIVHPECNFDVVREAHLFGSTNFIIEHIEKAPKGSKFAVGTEINLVNRLAKRFPEMEITSLSPYQCLCTTMYRIRPRWLLDSFRAIKAGKPINVIKVDEKTKQYSIIALDRMLKIS